MSLRSCCHEAVDDQSKCIPGGLHGMVVNHGPIIAGLIKPPGCVHIQSQPLEESPACFHGHHFLFQTVAADVDKEVDLCAISSYLSSSEDDRFPEILQHEGES